MQAGLFVFIDLLRFVYDVVILVTMITQLYDKLKPSHYQLMLDFDKEALTYSGTVNISARMTNPDTTVRVHANGLEIISALVNSEVAKVSSEEDDVLCLATKTEQSGDINIHITFKCVVTPDLSGVYPSYFMHNGIKKSLLATQFESHYARNAFPCVDEPSAKAVFELTTKSPVDEVVLANMPMLEQTEVSGKLVTTFEKTPAMSTYLVAFVIGELQKKESQTKDGVTVRSWSSVAQDPTHLEFSVNEAVAYIEFYNDYFKTDYPLSKCDQVALPDFEFGAMENWGLIVYRETAMLSDPVNVSISTQQLVSTVITHELSHQWFGNLVTMKWWDDLWLNESFANMIEYVAVDKRHPEWRMWEDYTAHDCLSATNRDVYKDVQSVSVHVEDPNEIGPLFDPSIVYAKGGKLLKTLMDLVGEEAWRSGLADYFKIHAYGNTTREDLWKCLNKYSDINVPHLMNTWIIHAGQPLVGVAQPSQDSDATLSQHRLLLDGSSDDVTWQIPLLSNQEPEDASILATRSESIPTKGWLQLNTSGTGHYIVNYENKDHKAWLIQQLADKEQPATWKIARLNELIMLAQSGTTSLTESLDATAQLKNEESAAVWSLIAHILGSARQIIEGDKEAEAAVKKYTYELVLKQLKELDWEYEVGESSNQTHLRSTITSLAIASEEPDIIELALQRYISVDSPLKLHPEARTMLMAAAVKFGTSEQFDSLLSDYKTTSNAEYQTDITSALTATRDPKRITQLTELMLDTDVVRTQDTYRWFAYLMRNRYSREAAWNWLVDNWQWILKTFSGSKGFHDFARYGESFLNTTAWLAKYKEFFEPKMNDPSLKRTIAIGITEISAKATWRERDQAAVIKWLKKQ
jgi:aminopeptidase N